MRLCIDIDGTICHTNGTSYEDATPNELAIEAIRKLKQKGHYIILHTARGSKTGIDFGELTQKQMELWNVPFDELKLGKPYADLYIDDKAFDANMWHEFLNAPNLSRKTSNSSTEIFLDDSK